MRSRCAVHLDGNAGGKRKKGATTTPHKEAAAPKGGSGRKEASGRPAPEAQTPDDNHAKGRKPKPLTKVCGEHLQDFNAGNESSLHFGGEMEVAPAVLAKVHRHCAEADPPRRAPRPRRQRRSSRPGCRLNSSR